MSHQFSGSSWSETGATWMLHPKVSNPTRICAGSFWGLGLCRAGTSFHSQSLTVALSLTKLQLRYRCEKSKVKDLGHMDVPLVSSSMCKTTSPHVRCRVLKGGARTHTHTHTWTPVIIQYIIRIIYPNLPKYLLDSTCIILWHVQFIHSMS